MQPTRVNCFRNDRVKWGKPEYHATLKIYSRDTAAYRHKPISITEQRGK